MNLSNKIEDSEVSIRIKNGEKLAYQVLFERYAPRIFHFSLQYLKNENESEELVQDVFLKVWEKRDSIDETKNIKSFLFKIAVNTIYDFIRRKNIEKAFHDFSAHDFEEGLDTTWHSVIFEEMLARLNALIDQFPEQRKKIYRLSKEEGLSNEEIATKLNLSKRTVENQLYRALAILKEHFKSESVLAILFLYLMVG